MKTTGFVLRAALAVAALLLASCTPDGGTIYATVESETRTTDNSLPNTLTVSALASPGVSGTWYVAAGTLYKGVLSAGSVTWLPNPSAPTRSYNPADSLANALAYYNGRLWGGFITAGTNLGLYSSAVSAPGYDASAFTADTDANVLGKEVTMLRVANNHLFMAGATLSGSPLAYHYELDYNASGAGWSPPALSGLASPIVGVAWDGGSTYYIASGAAVYSDSNPGGAFATVEAVGIAAGDQVNDIVGDPVHQRVFVTTQKGGLYYKYGAAAWAAIPAPQVNSATVSLLSIAGPIDTAGANEVYLLGTDGYGYYTLSVAGGSLTRFSDSTIALYAASVGRLLVDSGTVLMGTNGAGLWRATFDTTSGALASAWTHE